MDTLTLAEEDIVNQFISITNYPDEPHTAIQYLQACDWNLERSIIFYYEQTPEANERLNNNSRNSAFPGSFPGQSNPIQDTTNPSQTNQTPSDDRPFLDTIRNRLQSIFRSTEQYIPLSNSSNSTVNYLSLSPENKLYYAFQLILYAPITILYRVSEVIFYVLMKIFPIFRKFTRRLSQNRHSSKSEPKGIEPSHIARNFISDFNTYYRNDDRVDFFEGGYTSAVYLAKRDARFLAVYLHSEDHDDTNEFVNETLLNPITLKFFRDHNILIWGGDVHESEAYQVTNALNVTKYPYLGLLCLKSNTQETPEGTTTSAPSLTVVSKVQGLVTPSKLIDKFGSQIERFEPSLIALRTERQQQELSRVIRQQQDQAYQASLQRDRAIAEERAQQAQLIENKAAYLKWRRSNLLPEIDNTLKGDYARVAIRLPNGERISRRFDKNAKLEEVYAFTELYQKGLLNEPIENFPEPPSSFIYPYDFKLISPMPRAEIAPSLDIFVKDEPSIWPNGNLIVEEADQ